MKKKNIFKWDSEIIESVERVKFGSRVQCPVALDQLKL